MTAEKETIKLDAYFLFLIFPIFSFLISSLWAVMLLPVDVSPLTELFPDPGLGLIGGVFYAILFVLIALLSAFIVYYLIEKERGFVLKYMLGFAIAFVVIVILPLYASLILSWLNLDPVTSQAVFMSFISLSIIVGLLSSYAVISSKADSALRNIMMIIYSSIVSSFLALIIPTWILIFVLIGISIYDLYSVRKGPIKKVLQISEKKGGFDLKLYVNIGPWEIGIGDLVFYSVLIAHSLLFYGILIWVLSIISLMLGLIITLFVLSRKNILPGLPIALFIGIIPLLAVYLFL